MYIYIHTYHNIYIYIYTMDGGCVENCDDSTSLEVYVCLDIWVPLSTPYHHWFHPH